MKTFTYTITEGLYEVVEPFHRQGCPATEPKVPYGTRVRVVFYRMMTKYHHRLLQNGRVERTGGQYTEEWFCVLHEQDFPYQVYPPTENNGLLEAFNPGSVLLHLVKVEED